MIIKSIINSNIHHNKGVGIKNPITDQSNKIEINKFLTAIPISTEFKIYPVKFNARATKPPINFIQILTLWPLILPLNRSIPRCCSARASCRRRIVIHPQARIFTTKNKSFTKNTRWVASKSQNLNKNPRI